MACASDRAFTLSTGDGRRDLQMQVAVVPHGCGVAAREFALLPTIIGPDTGDRETTDSARSLFDAVLQNLMPGPAHQQFPALRSGRVLSVPVDIAFIDQVRAGTA